MVSYKEDKFITLTPGLKDPIRDRRRLRLRPRPRRVEVGHMSDLEGRLSGHDPLRRGRVLQEVPPQGRLRR
jgi:hypothetical protein